MTAGTKAILLLSVFGLVVLVACYGDGPSSNQADQAISTRSADPLLASASEISSPRQRTPANRPPVRQATPPPKAIASPSAVTQMSSPAVPARSVKVVRDEPSQVPTFTMGVARTAGMKVPSPGPSSRGDRAGAGVGRPTVSKTPISSMSSEKTVESRPIQTSKPEPKKAVAVHIIKPGDTLGHIAQKYYGSASKWSRIADANPSIDVNSLRVGQELRIPSRPMSPSADRTVRKSSLPRLTGKTHTIDEGETLSSIAEDHLGDQTHWYRIYELNKDRIGGSPDRLVVGMVIAVPE